MDGLFNVYAVATANDGTMQTQVVGPWTFRRATAMYDRTDLTVVPSLSTSGTRFQTCKAAIDYCQTNGILHPKITLMETATYAIASVATPNNATDGWITFVADTGVTATFGNAAFGDMRFRRDKVMLQGPGIVVDIANVDQWWLEDATGSSAAFKGVAITDSLGRDRLINGRYRYNIWNRTTSGQNFFFENCTFSDILYVAQNAVLTINCTLTNVGGDHFQNSLNVNNCTVNGSDSSWFRTSVDAMTVTYAGAGTTATVTRTGTNNFSGNFVLNVNGSAVLTITLTTTTTVSGVVNAINAFGTGWSATLLDDTRSSLALSHASTSPAGFTNINAKNVTVTCTTIFDIHDDSIQYTSTSGNINNRVFENIQMYNCLAMQYEFYSTNSAVAFQDIAIVNVVSDNNNNPVNGSNVSQYGALSSDVMTCQLTHPCVPFWFRTDSAGNAKYVGDAYCYVYGSAFYILLYSSTADPNQVIDHNHIVTGSTPSTATNTSTGGSSSTLFTDPASYDYSPKSGGALITNGCAPFVEYDVFNNLRSATNSALGAIAAPAEYTTSNQKVLSSVGNSNVLSCPA